MYLKEGNSYTHPATTSSLTWTCCFPENNNIIYTNNKNNRNIKERGNWISVIIHETKLVTLYLIFRYFIFTKRIVYSGSKTRAFLVIFSSSHHITPNQGHVPFHIKK